MQISLKSIFIQKEYYTESSLGLGQRLGLIILKKE